MRIFKSKWFDRYARKEGISDDLLLDAVARAERGQIDADLGGEVIKQRIARPGEGRSKGYRTILLLRRGAKAYFVYGFSKSERVNISVGEQRDFKDSAKVVLSMTDATIKVRLQRGDFVEVNNANE